MQPGTGAIEKARGFASGQDRFADGGGVARRPSGRLRKCSAHNSSSSVRCRAYLPIATKVMRSGPSEIIARAVALAVTNDAA